MEGFAIYTYSMGECQFFDDFRAGKTANPRKLVTGGLINVPGVGGRQGYKST